MLLCLDHLPGFYTQDGSSMEILALGEVLHGRVLTVLFWDKIANLPEKTDPLTGSVVLY